MSAHRDAVPEGASDERLASALGLTMWGLRFAPELLTGSARLLLNPSRLYRRARGQSRTATVLHRSLAEVLPGLQPASGLGIQTVRRLAFERGRDKVAVRVPYGPSPRQTVEIWRSARVDTATRPAPVLVFIPGGGWVHGTTFLQGSTLLGHLAARGWVCVGVNYRASPAYRWPAHIEDVKRAVAWVRREIGEYGGDPGCIAIAGASAGGHLAALAGLTADDRSWQPGFEDEPTHVSAVVGLYGRYDWESRDTLERRRFMTFLERMVVGRRQADDPDVFTQASPLRHVGPHAPPFFVIHGRSDAIIPVRQARAFVERLREVSTNAVVYAELPGTGHGFDVVDPFRAAHMARAVERFLRATCRGDGQADENGTFTSVE